MKSLVDVGSLQKWYGIRRGCPSCSGSLVKDQEPSSLNRPSKCMDGELWSLIMWLLAWPVCFVTSHTNVYGEEHCILNVKHSGDPKESFQLYKIRNPAKYNDRKCTLAPNPEVLFSSPMGYIFPTYLYWGFHTFVFSLHQILSEQGFPVGFPLTNFSWRSWVLRSEYVDPWSVVSGTAFARLTPWCRQNIFGWLKQTVKFLLACIGEP